MEIHTLLENTFGTHPSWTGKSTENKPSLIRYEYDCSADRRRLRLCFFPVDNTARPDPATDQLRAKLVDAISKQPHVRRLVPFSWLKLLDQLRARSAASKSITLGEVKVAASECGVVAVHVELALRLFNELGLVMHHPEPALRDLVVLDPASFLVEPAARVVCQYDIHAATLLWHSDAKIALPDDYNRLLRSGRLSRGLLKLIWSDRREHIEVLERLVVLYGLIVRASGSLVDGSDAGEFIVPAVLPGTALNLTTFWRASDLPAARVRAVILFGEARYLGDNGEWRNRGWATAEEVARDGFLPAGLFAQVLFLPVCLTVWDGGAAAAVSVIRTLTAEWYERLHAN